MRSRKLSIWMWPLTAVTLAIGCQSENVSVDGPIAARSDSTQGESENEAPNQTAILGGGCFWCVEADFEKLPGVTDVVSGYSGGTTENPTYEDYAAGGHIEVVKVTYDPSQVNFAGLVEWMIKHSDPTDADGSFADRGREYSPIVYYSGDDQKNTAERVFNAVDELNVYPKKLAVALKPVQKFWPAEDYHQDYHSESLVKYDYYRYKSGRDEFIEKHWGDRAKKLELPESVVTESASDQSSSDDAATAAVSASDSSATAPWENFRKPSDNQLRKTLTDTQYNVTQEEGTEQPFNNEYWDNKEAGIYVDVVSGEPLFLSTDKFRSGTGWPSFVQPLDAKFIELRTDSGLLGTRIEVRSKLADSHIGHVFEDGPSARGGKRYCMNSAALRFVPKENMEAEGYGGYVADAKKPE